MSTRKRKSKVKLIGAFFIIVGALVVVAAGVTLGMVSSELKVEHIAVTAAAPHGAATEAHADPFNTYTPTGLNQANSRDFMALPSTQDSALNGSFLHALFFIAAVALAIAAPVMGLGVLFAVIGIGPIKGGPRRRPDPVPSGNLG